MIVHYFNFWLFLPALFVFEIEEVEAGTFHRVSRYPNAEEDRAAAVELLPKILISYSPLINKSTYRLMHYTSPGATKYCKTNGVLGHEHYFELLYNGFKLDFFCAADPLNTDGFKEVTHCYGSRFKQIDQLIIRINQGNISNCYNMLYEVYLSGDNKENLIMVETKRFDCDGQLTAWHRFDHGWGCG